MKTRRQRKVKKGKSRRFKGGRYIFHGTYGCTYRPSIKCKEDKERIPDTVSKLMKEEYATIEYKFKAKLEKIDPTQKYLLYPSKMCEPDITVNPENEYDKCPRVNIKDGRSKLIIYKDGGNDLQHIIVQKEDYVEFFKGLLNLFEGLETMHANNFVHMDIKPPNLVAIKKDDGTFHIRFIDFSLSDSVYKASLSDYSANYPYWPYDLRLLNPDYIYKSNRLLQSELDEFYTHFPHGSFPMWTWYDDNYKQRITPDYTRITARDIKDTPKSGEDIVKSGDVFALGRSLIEIYSQLTGHTLLRGNKIRVQTAESYETELADKISKPLYALLVKMTSPYYNKRPTAKEAKEEYSTIIPAMEEAFGQWKLIENVISPLTDLTDLSPDK